MLMKITLQYIIDNTTKIGVERIVPTQIDYKELSSLIFAMKNRLEKKVEAFLLKHPKEPN